MPRWYAISSVRLATGCIGIVALLAGSVNQLNAAPFMAGADISALPVLEAGGAQFSDGGAPGDAINILSSHGVGWYRLRIFVDPDNDSDPFVVNDLNYTLALAERVKAAGGKLLLDFHYSDTWADPGKQYIPEAWDDLSFSQLRDNVQQYSQQTIEAFANQGVMPDMVQVGNEISNGMLWPEGYLWTGGSHDTGFNRLAELLEAGIDGVNAGAGPGNEPTIMIHHDRGHDWGATSYYFDKLMDRNLDFDVIGYSYYPKHHFSPSSGEGGIDDVAANFNNTALEYGKPVVLVETGFASRGQQFEPNYEFPVSEAGQREFLDAMIDMVQAVPNGLGAGVFWWYADATPVSGLPVWEGGRYGLFDQTGDLLDAARAFEEFLPPVLPGDFNEDGAVTLADYTVWRDGLGDAYTSDHYKMWKTYFGAGAASAVTARPIPEPPSMVSMALFAVMIHWRTRRYTRG